MRRYLIPIDMEKVIKMAKAGSSCQEIADLYRVNRDTIRKRLAGVGVTPVDATPRVDPAIVEEVIRRYLDGETSGEIARSMGRSRNSIIGIVYRAGAKRDADVQRVAMSRTHRAALSRARAAPRAPRAIKPPKPAPAPKTAQVVELRPATVSRIGIAGNGATFEQAPQLTIPPLRDAAATGEPARIMDEHFGGCRWPISGEGADMTFCCGPRDEGKTYCAAHNPLAFSPAQPKPLMKLASIDRNVRRSSPYREEAA